MTKPTESVVKPPSADKPKREKKHAYSIQLPPKLYKRARLLATLKGIPISRIIEDFLTTLVASELRGLVEGLDEMKGS